MMRRVQRQLTHLWNGRTGIVLISAAVVASMVASVVSGPSGSSVLAQDGYGRRERDAGSIVAALFEANPKVELGHRSIGSGSRREHERRLATITPRQHPAEAVHWSAPRSNAAALRTTPRRVPFTAARLVSDAPSELCGHHAVCVRLCDGFYFPMGAIAGQADVDSRTSLCSGLCPGAPTRLFVTPGDADDMSRATSVSTGEAYPGLAVAFAHTRAVGPTCACHPAEGEQSARISPLTDFTLRSGDSIMTPIGWRVFQGSDHWPYRRDDFRSIRSTHNISPMLRSTLASIEDASLGRRIASRLPPLVVTRRIRIAASAKPADDAAVQPAGEPLAVTP